MLKPSEISPATASALSELLPKYLDTVSMFSSLSHDL